MSTRPTQLLAKHLLVDTHCHLHVSRGSIARATGAVRPQPCCGDNEQIPPQSRHGQRNVNNNTYSSESTREVAVREDVAPDGCEGRILSTIKPLPQVLHITMGIKEEDWAAALRFAPPRCAGDSAAADDDSAATNGNAGGVADSFRAPSGTSKAKPAGAEMEENHPQVHPETRAEGAGSGDDRCGSVAAAPFFRVGLGLHPWSAHSRSEGWLRDLTALLEEHPYALLGEIGLDKVARTAETRKVEWEDQLEVFLSQMTLAARLSRPVSVHCVKAYGKIVDYLKDPGEYAAAHSEGTSSSRTCGGERDVSKDDSSGGDGAGHKVRPARAGVARHGGAGFGGSGVSRELQAETSGRSEQAVLERDRGGSERPRERVLPPRIALHSFTGSVEVAKDITRLARGPERDQGQVYFGFSAAVNMRGDRETKRLMDVLRVVPDSRILIETDRQAPLDDGAAAEELLRVCDAIAEAKGISVEEAVVLANGNAARFLGRP